MPPSSGMTAKILRKARRMLSDGSMRMMIFIMVLVIIGIFMLPE